MYNNNIYKSVIVITNKIIKVITKINKNLKIIKLIKINKN